MYEIDQNIDKMEELSAEDLDAVKLYVNNRWKLLHTDMHSAG